MDIRGHRFPEKEPYRTAAIAAVVAVPLVALMAVGLGARAAGRKLAQFVDERRERLEVERLERLARGVR